MRQKALPLVAIIVITVATLAGGYYGAARAQRAAATGAADEVPGDLADGLEEALVAVQESYRAPWTWKRWAGTRFRECLGSLILIRHSSPSRSSTTSRPNKAAELTASA